MSTRPRLALRLAAAVVLGLAAICAAPACSGGPRTFDHLELERGILDQSSDPFPIASVTCPEDRPLAEGDTFTCQAMLGSGEAVTIDATQTDGDGNITWNRHEAIVTGEAFAGIENGAISRDYGLPITLACPERIVMNPGDTFTCTGTDDRARSRTVTFTAVDPRSGQFTYVVDGLPPPSTTTTTAA